MIASGTPPHFFKISLDTCSNSLGHPLLGKIFFYKRAFESHGYKEASSHKPYHQLMSNML
jgi:hypothetical protein